MSVAQMRPTFLFETDLGADEVIQCVQSSFAERSDDYQMQLTSRHAMVSINETKRHFWSPWLHLEVREQSPRCQVFGRYSPHPSIWTGFMFAYLSIGVIVFFAAMFGMSQQLAGQSPWAYYLIPIGMVVAALLWFASKAGQRLAHDEMDQISMMIQECLVAHEPVPEKTPIETVDA